MRTQLTYCLVAVAALASAHKAHAGSAFELPPRKAGYWEIRMVHEAPKGDPDLVMHACLDAASDKAMMQAGLSMTSGMCEKNDMSREGDVMVIDAICTIGSMKTASRSVITGDFQSDYMVKMTGTVDGMPKIAGAGDGPVKSDMTQMAKWLGDTCPDGVKPGDMRMPGGVTVNVNEALAKSPLGKPKAK